MAVHNYKLKATVGRQQFAAPKSYAPAALGRLRLTVAWGKISIYITLCSQSRRRRRLKGIHSRSDTNRTGAIGVRKGGVSGVKTPP